MDWSSQIHPSSVQAFSRRFLSVQMECPSSSERYTTPDRAETSSRSRIPVASRIDRPQFTALLSENGGKSAVFVVHIRSKMPSMSNWTFSSLTIACLLGSLFLFSRMKKLKFEIDEKKCVIEATEESLWQLNSDLSRSILSKLRLVDRLSSSQV